MSGILIQGLLFKATRKKQYDVYVCRPEPGTYVRNKLEGTEYRTDKKRQFVISGTVGEQWVLDVNKLANTYTFMNGSQITADALRSRMKPNGIIPWMHLKSKVDMETALFAAHLPLNRYRNFPTQTSWGDILYANRDGIMHGPGDFIVCASVHGEVDTRDPRVVNGNVIKLSRNAFVETISRNFWLQKRPFFRPFLQKVRERAADSLPNLMTL